MGTSGSHPHESARGPGAQSVPPRARPPAGSQLLAALLCAQLCACTSTPEPLPLVPRPAQPDEAPPLRYRFTWSASAPEGADVLWVPVPGTDRWQTVRTLAVEVGAPGQLVATPAEEGQERELEVRSPGAPVVVRGVIERPRLDPTPLPAPLDAISPDLAPDAWAAQAVARGARARVVHGLELRPDGTTSPRSWPEVLVAGAWTPVDAGKGGLPPGCVRVSTKLARAEVSGQSVDATLEGELRLAP